MKPNPKGNLNVPLGPGIGRVEKQAEKVGVTKTELGRMMIMHCTRKMEAGELSFEPPSLSETPIPVGT